MNLCHVQGWIDKPDVHLGISSPQNVYLVTGETQWSFLLLGVFMPDRALPFPCYLLMRLNRVENWCWFFLIFCCMMHTDTGKKGKWGECEMRCAKTGCQLFTQKCRERKRSWKPKMWKMAHTAFLFCSWWPHYCGWRWKCPNRAFILPHTPCSPLMEHTCCRKVQLLTLCS